MAKLQASNLPQSVKYIIALMRRGLLLDPQILPKKEMTDLYYKNHKMRSCESCAFLWPILLLLLSGCPSKAIKSNPTFSEDIAPIIFKNCAPCHRPGEAGPF